MAGARACPSCSQTVVPTGPGPIWKLALVGGYGVISVMVVCSSLLGLGILGMLPVLAISGFGVLPPLHELAGTPPSCPNCGKYMD
ncbi:MAG: hypothetical protein AB2A00_12215 [Myxococcota bacterium]